MMSCRVEGIALAQDDEAEEGNGMTNVFLISISKVYTRRHCFQFLHLLGTH